MEAYKKTALRLHGMNKSDRQWLLGQLPEFHRKELTLLLDELKTLGIPQESVSKADLDDLTRDTGPTAHESQTHHFLSSYIKTIAHAKATAVSAILHREPDPVIAAVLQIFDWPWRQVVLEALPLTRRSVISEALQNRKYRLTEKASEAVLKIFSERIGIGDTYLFSAGADDHIVKEPRKTTRRLSFLRRWHWQR